jgi:hypothetical protein
MFKRARTQDSENNDSSMERFVPACHWDELRRQYPPEPSQKRGLRRLSNAMQSENPECSGIEAKWTIPATDCLPEANLEIIEEDLSLVRTVADLDACYASEAFLDDLDWAAQRFAVDSRANIEVEAVMDEELSMLEAVQDLSRFVARTTPRRAASAPSSRNLSSWNMEQQSPTE